MREKGNYKYNTRWCYYDFFLPYYRIYIEVDGESHNNDKQKAIDKEKMQIIKNKQRFLVRLTNDEVLAMNNFSIDEIIDKLAVQLKTRRHPNRDYKGRYFKNLGRNYQQSIVDMKKSAKFDIDETKAVYLYDHHIGNYFCFNNIYEAKLNTQLSINDIFNLLNDFEYKRCSYRRYVFGWTLDECKNNVAKVY